MKKYEFIIIEKSNVPALEKALDEIGEQGWRVKCMSEPATFGIRLYTVILEREKQDAK